MVINHASHRTATRLSLDREPIPFAAVVITASRSRRPLLAGAARSSIDECSAVARARHYLTQTSACRNACEAPSPCTPVHREFQTHARNVRFGPPTSATVHTWWRAKLFSRPCCILYPPNPDHLGQRHRPAALQVYPLEVAFRSRAIVACREKKAEAQPTC